MRDLEKDTGFRYRRREGYKKSIISAEAQCIVIKPEGGTQTTITANSMGVPDNMVLLRWMQSVYCIHSTDQGWRALWKLPRRTPGSGRVDKGDRSKPLPSEDMLWHICVVNSTAQYISYCDISETFSACVMRLLVNLAPPSQTDVADRPD
jgi:hypothetical protein